MSFKCCKEVLPPKRQHNIWNTHLLPKLPMRSLEPSDGNTPTVLPYLACLTFIFTWAGWIVVSRHGTQTAMTPVDLIFIRFLTALVASSPLWFFYGWRKIPWYRVILVAWGTGVVYLLFCFAAMSNAKAASAGVLINGLLPLFGAIIGYLWLGQRPSRVTLLCIVAILISNIMLIQGDMVLLASGRGPLSVLLFTAASCTFSFYMVAVKKWGFSLLDVVIWVPLVNALTITPVWLCCRSGLPATPISIIAGQALFQGVLITLVAGAIIAYAIRSLGPMTTSMFGSFVPAVAAVLGLLLLGEQLTPLELAAIALCTCALVINSRWGSGSQSRVLK